MGWFGVFLVAGLAFGASEGGERAARALLAASDMPTFGTNSAAQVACCCSPPHTAEIWAPLVSTTLCADAADENRDISPSTSVG